MHLILALKRQRPKWSLHREFQGIQSDSETLSGRRRREREKGRRGEDEERRERREGGWEREKGREEEKKQINFLLCLYLFCLRVVLYTVCIPWTLEEGGHPRSVTPALGDLELLLGALHAHGAQTNTAKRSDTNGQNRKGVVLGCCFIRFRLLI